MLFAFTVTTQSLLIIVMAAALSAFALGWLLRKDTAFEAYQRGVMKLIAKLRQLNFVPGGLIDQMCKLFECIVIKDVNGFYQSIKSLADRLDEPDAVMGMLRADFKAQFPDILAKPDVGQFIIEQVHAHEAQLPPAAATK